MSSFARLFALVGLVALGGCSSGTPTATATEFNVPDRAPGVRAPLTAACGTQDPNRCLFPWPSSTFTKADASTPTGIQVDVAQSSILSTDSVAPLNIADGFSTVTPLVTGWSGMIGDIPVAKTGEGPVRLFFAQHGQPGVGTSLPLRFDVEQDSDAMGNPESMVFAYPLRPLQPDSDYVACVMDDLPVTAGAPLTPSHDTEVALGLVGPATLTEAQLAAYHAPTRAVLQGAGIDFHHVLMVWDFTTRSAEDPLTRLAAMKKAALEAVTKKTVTVTLTKLDMTGPAPIAIAVEGTLDGLPEFISPTVGSSIKLDANGLPVQIGTRSAPFRVVVPVGTGDYPAVMYGHGTGGDYDETTLDTNIAAIGAAKVAGRWDGWNGTAVLDTFVGLTAVFTGARFAIEDLMQALADATALQASLAGVLGDALSAPTLLGKPNPAMGRRPDASRIMWAGGSLGGILSLVQVSADTSLKNGVLNVPGAAWTHFIPKSLIFQMIAGLLQVRYQGSLNVLQALAMTQGQWDEIDGAVWGTQLAGRDTAFLIQESIGDPVVPNPGTEMVAVVTGATQVGKVLVPVAAGIPTTTGSVADKSGITQFEVTSCDPFDIHGFAAQNTPAGDAARAQIQAFVESCYAGKPVVAVPSGCPGGDCNFSQ